MSNQVYIGPARLRRPGKAFLVPLLIISLVIYNVIRSRNERRKAASAAATAAAYPPPPPPPAA